jgi:hypothetical protein
VSTENTEMGASSSTVRAMMRKPSTSLYHFAKASTSLVATVTWSSWRGAPATLLRREGRSG